MVDMVGMYVDMDDRGPAIELVDGSRFFLLDPRPEDVHIEHIAHATAHLCRFTGHCRTFYSVAQHGIHVSRMIPAEHALWGLLHDATEAYIADLSRPLKWALEKKAPGVLKGIESGIALAIATRFDLSWPMPPDVKRGDNIALATEKRDLLSSDKTYWTGLPDPDPESIIPLDPDVACAAYLDRFMELDRSEETG